MKTRLLYCTALLAISIQANAAITVVERPAPQGANDYFGSGVAVVADQNSDGIRDLVVGSIRASILNSPLVEPSRANVVSGATGAHLSAILPPSPVDSGLFGEVKSLTDFTGDGVPEFAILESRSCYVCNPLPPTFGDGRVHLYNGASLSLMNTFTHPNSVTNVSFGEAVDVVPDTNNDGVADISISASTEVISGQTYKGKIFLYSGSTYALLNTLSSPSEEASGFGADQKGIADLTGDGRGDLIVSCFDSQGSGAQSSLRFSRVYAINSQTGAIIREYVNPNPSNNFGASLSVIADQTSDGIGEVLVSWYFNQNAGSSNLGKVMVFNSATGSAISTINASNGVSRDLLGIITGNVHDLNADSINDYFYAPYSSGGRSGNGQIVFMNGANNAELFAYNSPNNQDSGLFVRAYSHPDFSGDSKPDLIFAASGEEPGSFTDSNKTAGRIYLVSGATAVLSGSTLFSKSVTTPSTSRTYTLSNTGVEPLDINSIQLTNNASGAFQFASAPDTSDLAIGATRNIVVNFVSPTAGTYNANLVVDTTSDDPSYTLIGYNYSPEIYNNRPIYFSADNKVYLIQTENTSPTLITDNTKIGSPLNYIFAMSYDSQSSLLLQNFITSSGGDKYNIQRVNLITGNRTTISDDTNFAQGAPMGALKEMIVDAPRNRILASSPAAGIIAFDQTTGNRSNFTNNFTGYSSITKAPTGEIYCLPTSASRIDKFNPATNTFSSITLLSPQQEFTRIVQGSIFAKSATQLVGHSGGYYPVSINLTNQTITDLLSYSNPLSGSAGGPSIADAGASFDTSGYDLKAGYFLRRNSSVGLVLMEETSLFRRTLINTAAVTGTYRMQTVTVPYETYNQSSVPTITLGNTTYDLPGGARLTFFNNQSVSILETSFFPSTARNFVPNPYPGIWTFNGLINGTFSCGMRFPYQSTTVAQAGLNEQNAVIYRSTDNGATWQPVPSTVNTAGDYVETTNPVSAFSQWTIGFTTTTSVENWSMHE